MGPTSPCSTGLWADRPTFPEYYPDYDEDFEQQDCLTGGVDEDGRTPLDKIIDRIGMGSYQWTLLLLCGFGWMADNMWIQAIAIILPRIQQHYAVPDSYIGAVSSSMFAGMMVGAVGWGTCSDLMGRSSAFNATLFFTGVFGLFASFSNSFFTLCIALFFLGSSVGGSMPTDGTLLLEHMPKEKQYLVTALSIFFSFGAVLSAVVALLVIPQHSCPPSTLIPCEVGVQNRGWKYLLVALGIITLSMFLARIVFFRLHESPRYLVHAGRPQDAIKSLQLISRFNGSTISVELEDVRDYHRDESATAEGDFSKFNARLRANSTTAFATSVIPDESTSTTRDSSTGSSQASRSTLLIHYASTGETPNLDSRANSTQEQNMPSDSPIEPMLKNATTTVGGSRAPRNNLYSDRHRCESAASRQSSVHEKKVCHVLSRWSGRLLWAWWERVMMVLEPEWLRTTILVWSSWCAMSLAYTMFNVFLPKLLETRPNFDVPQTLEQSLWDVVIFTLGGCPGAILGAYLIRSKLGRRWSLAGSTFITAFFCVVFVLVKPRWAVRLSTVGISLSVTTMWAVLYGWTPEIFGTKIRGTACGIASALSRIGGMIAPMLGGILLMMNRSIPVYTSVVIFAIAGFCVLLLKEEAGEGAHVRGRPDRVIIH